MTSPIPLPVAAAPAAVPAVRLAAAEAGSAAAGGLFAALISALFGDAAPATGACVPHAPWMGEGTGTTFGEPGDSEPAEKKAKESPAEAVTPTTAPAAPAVVLPVLPLPAGGSPAPVSAAATAAAPPAPESMSESAAVASIVSPAAMDAPPRVAWVALAALQSTPAASAVRHGATATPPQAACPASADQKIEPAASGTARVAAGPPGESATISDAAVSGGTPAGPAPSGGFHLPEGAEDAGDGGQTKVEIRLASRPPASAPVSPIALDMRITAPENAIPEMPFGSAHGRVVEGRDILRTAASTARQTGCEAPSPGPRVAQASIPETAADARPATRPSRLAPFAAAPAREAATQPAKSPAGATPAGPAQDEPHGEVRRPAPAEPAAPPAPPAASASGSLPAAAGHTPEKAMAQPVFEPPPHTPSSDLRPAPPPVRESVPEIPPARPAEPVVPEPASRIEPVRELAFRLEGASDAVDVRLSARGGSVQIAVHTADPDLAGTLRQHVGELESRLEGHGYQAQSWQPKAPGESARPGSDPGYSAGQQHQGRGGSGSERRRNPRQNPAARDRKEFSWIVSSIR